ncbi:MAG TPA: hypothetical protein VJ875_16930 [Pyrinomonadaceae bacterium]|nr:hypothetical protein [Pyrinomonadaceae bacterium]
MYCSSCGVAVAQGLSYCNHCGAKLNRSDVVAKSAEVKPGLLVNAMVVTFIFGLGAIGMLMGIMKVILGLRVEPILAFMLLPLMLMLVLEGVFMRLLLRGNRGTRETSDKELSNQQTTTELDAAQTPALPEGMPSVTEHTTRAFDPIYTERKSR